jgi:hypothetical protein
MLTMVLSWIWVHTATLLRLVSKPPPEMCTIPLNSDLPTEALEPQHFLMNALTKFDAFGRTEDRRATPEAIYF